MYHSIIPVSESHDPIVVEGDINSQVLLFNAGPATIEAKIWRQWFGKNSTLNEENKDKPDYNLELRSGNQRVVSGSFIRLGLKYRIGAPPLPDGQFAAVGTRIISDNVNNR